MQLLRHCTGMYFVFLGVSRVFTKFDLKGLTWWEKKRERERNRNVLGRNKEKGVYFYDCIILYTCAKRAI